MIYSHNNESFNRTIVELKFEVVDGIRPPFQAFNRTIVELKCRIVNSGHSLCPLLIVP